MKSKLKYIVCSTDKKWFATGECCFSEDKELAHKFTKDEANEIISSISVMELEMIAA